MTRITVKIQPTGLDYDPTSLVRHGDEVTFRLDGVASAKVTFDGASCFADPGPYSLNNTTLGASESEHTVTLTCPAGSYPFTVQIPDPSQSRDLRGGHGGNFETKKGGLDVTTDPPEDKDKKPKK